MKAIKQFLSGIFLCLAEIVVGVLLLLDPVSLTTSFITVCGLALILWGFSEVFRYFRTEASQAAESQGLMKGLILLALGGFAALNSGWFLATFPLMTFVYGIVILLSGFGKLQWAVDMLRSRNKKWFWAAISAAVSIVCSAVILSSPFTSTAVLWRFTGISLICEAFLDLFTFFVSTMKRKATAEETIIDAPVEDTETSN